MSQKLETGIQRLIETHRFYGEIIQRMKRKKCNEIPTMGVTYEDESVVLYYNEFFLENMTHNETAAVLEHECNHILGDHFERETEIEPEFNRKEALKEDASMVDKLNTAMTAKILNICEDVAINQWIPNIPTSIITFDKDGNPTCDTREKVIDELSLKKYLNKGFQIKEEKDLEKFLIDNDSYGLPLVGQPCTLESFKKLLPDDVKVLDKQPFEYYYELLKENGDKEMLEKMAGGIQKVITTLDEHGMDEASGGKDQTDPEMRKEMARQLANEAVKSMEDDRQAGSISAHAQSLLDALNKKPKNWKRDIAKFTAKATSIYKEITRSRRNRRQRKDEPLVPGYRNTTSLNLIFAIDTSGSQSEEVLEQIAAEGKKLSDMGVKLCLIECDTEINSIREYKGEKTLKVHGRGGTKFNPVFELVNSKEFANKWGAYDGLIFFTDGMCWEAGNELIKPKMPMMWAMNDGQKKPDCNFGWETEIIIQNR